MLKKRILARLRQHRERHQRQKYGTYCTNAGASYHPVGNEMLPIRPELLPIQTEGQTPTRTSMMTAAKIRPAAVKVGIRLPKGERFGFHNFRRSLATFLVNRGTDVKTTQGLLRHAKLTTTLDLYSQSIDASKLDAQKEMAMAITNHQPSAD